MERQFRSSGWEALWGWGLPGRAGGWDRSQLRAKCFMFEWEAPAGQQSSGECGGRGWVQTLPLTDGQISSLSLSFCVCKMGL